MLKLYSNPMSRGRIARWMMEEAGQPYEVEMVPFGPAMKSPDYRSMNPMGKVPVLSHDGRIVTECAAICAYMADTFPQAGLAPPPDDRADYYRWLFFAAGPLEYATTNNALGVVVPDDRRAMVGYGSFEATLDTLDSLLSTRPFVTGEDFTAADVYLGAHVTWGLSFNSIPARPSFQAYRDRVTGRPAYTRATALDDAAMPPGA